MVRQITMDHTRETRTCDHDSAHPELASVGPRFLTGGSDIAAVIANQDWCVSPLGPIKTWPQSLRSALGLILASKFPMIVAWGPKLGFLYNDAYSELLGSKHPQALGKPFEEIWADIWSDILPLVEAALQGEATYHENLPLLTTRKGYEEQAWFTFSTRRCGTKAVKLRECSALRGRRSKFC